MFNASLIPLETDPYKIGEAIAAQVIRLAEQAQAGETLAPASASIIRNVTKAAKAALEAGGKCLVNGDLDAALFAIAAAEGAVSLIAALVSTPEDAFIQKMAEGFKPVTEVRQ